MTRNDRPFPFLSLIPYSQVILSHAEREGSSFWHQGLICASQQVDRPAPETQHPGPPCPHASIPQQSNSINYQVFCVCTQLCVMRTEPTTLCAKIVPHLLLVSFQEIWLVLRENVGRHWRTISICVALSMLFPMHGQVLTQEKANLSRLHLSSSV